MIINRYIIYNNIITVEDISIINAKIVTSSCLKKIKNTNNIKSIVCGGNGRNALTAFYSLPERLKGKIVEVFGLPPELIFSKDFNSIEKLIIKDKDYQISLLKEILKLNKENNLRLEKKIHNLKTSEGII